MDEPARLVDISLQLIRTETLPEGALFVSPDGVLYKVVMAERAGFRKADPWPGGALDQTSDARSPVALVPGSLLARNYPVVTEGRPLPVLSRSDFLGRERQPAHFIFPNESLARLAARLDETLAPRSGLAASKERKRWLLSDGQHDFRIYHYYVDNIGMEIDLASRFAQEHIEAQPCEQGPRYWRYLPGWQGPPDVAAPALEPVAMPEPRSEAEKVKAVTSVPVVVEPVQTQPVAEGSPPVTSPVPDVSRVPERRFGLQTLVGCLPWARFKKGPSTSPVVPPAVEGPEAPVAMQAPTIMDTLPVAPVPTMAEKSEPEPSIETAPEIVGSVEVEASQAQPAKEPSSEVVAPSAVETFEPQLVAEMPQETVIPSIVGELEAQTVTEMPAEAIASSATQRPKARAVAKSPAQKSKAQSVAELPAKSSKAVMPDRVVLAQSITPRSGRSHMILSIDIGYGYTKGVGPEGLRFSFPSVIGTAEEIPFSIGLTRGNEDQLVQYGDSTFSYGEQALLQSRIQTTIFDRSRIRDHVYKMLFVATLVEMSRLGADCKHVKVITGLPVDFFNDRAEVIKAFEGAYQITAGRAIKCTVDSVYVAPQPFGSLFRELLNDHGKIIDSDIEKRRIGVIDVGTYTTDFVVSDALRYVQRLSGTIRIGWSKVITKVQQALSDTYRLELVPHEVDRALQAGVARVHGKEVSLESFISPAVAEVQTAVVARARDLWGDAADLDSVLVTGGAGAPMYDAIQEVYPHARLLDNAFWANVEGLQRFARRPATFNE